MSSLDASCAHRMRRVRRDRASAAGCATTRATTTTRNATPTAIHAGMQTCIVDVGSHGQLTTTKSGQEKPRATKRNQSQRSAHEHMHFFRQRSVVQKSIDLLHCYALVRATAHSRLGFGELSRTTWRYGPLPVPQVAQMPNAETTSEVVHTGVRNLVHCHLHVSV